VSLRASDGASIPFDFAPPACAMNDRADQVSGRTSAAKRVAGSRPVTSPMGAAHGAQT
jgi:hypothetical protein